MSDTGTPFLLYLSVGYAVWLYASSVISQSSNVIRQYSFLVTKVSFPVALLPLVKLFSLFIVHWVFLALVFFLLVYHGYNPELSWLQVFYYQVCTMYLVLGISLILAALNVFFKDVQETVAIGLRIGFWLTPVFWSLEMLPEDMQSWMSLNPFYYLVDGYRRTFLFDEYFWQQENTFWFWSVSSVLLVIGMVLFRKLRPYFAEVL
jgi:teichoic acid transport system permease protein